MKNEFSFARTPQVHFGPGKISTLASAVKTFGSKILIVIGSKSFTSSTVYQDLLDQLQASGISFWHYAICSEPTPEMVDQAVQRFATADIDVVVSIGGGSVLDGGKAISAMLPINQPVKDYLEGVGTKSKHPGLKVPFIAVPTTSGTGSEATKNAVLSEIGEQGFKKSLRHNNFVPDMAIIDPALTISCPSSITAASGMDAFTQLLESYLSLDASPMTDALAYKGLEQIPNSLNASYHDGSNLQSRIGMALASYLSGITLANAGLGLVHGFAGVIGGYYSIPHGVICSSLMGAVNNVTVRKLRRERSNHQAMVKYAAIGKMFAGSNDKSEDFYIDFLLHAIALLAEEMKIPRLTSAGVRSTDFQKIVNAAENKNNPVALSLDEMLEVLEMAS